MRIEGLHAPANPYAAPGSWFLRGKKCPMTWRDPRRVARATEPGVTSPRQVATIDEERLRSDPLRAHRSQKLDDRHDVVDSAEALGDARLRCVSRRLFALLT